MDYALPYVIANLSALFLVGFVAHNRRSGKDVVAPIEQPVPTTVEAPIKQQTQSSVATQVRPIPLAKNVHALALANALTRWRIDPHDRAHVSPPIGEHSVTGGSIVLTVVMKREYAVILFKVDGTYTDPGGKLDAQDLYTCSSKELEEESLGTFRINLAKKIPHYPVRYIDYVGHFVAVRCKPIDPERVYRANFDFTQAIPNIPPAWKETSGMRYFSVQTLRDIKKTTSTKHAYKTVDMSGSPAFVSDRILGLIQGAHVSGVFTQMKKNATTHTVNLTEQVDRTGVGEVGSSIRARTVNATRCFMPA